MTRFPKWMHGLRTHRILYKDITGSGRLCPGLAEIWINSRLPYIEKVLTLIHELLHLHYGDVKDDGSVEPKREQEIEAEAKELLGSLTDREFGILEFFLSHREDKE